MTRCLYVLLAWLLAFQPLMLAHAQDVYEDIPDRDSSSAIGANDLVLTWTPGQQNYKPQKFSDVRAYAAQTVAEIRALLGLTNAELNDLLTGASISGNTLTFTQNDGTTIAITLPTGGGGGGITIDQARDAAGAILAALTEFTYNAGTNALTFTLPANSVTPAQAQANSDVQKTAWRNRINAISRADTATTSEAGVVQAATLADLNNAVSARYPDANAINTYFRLNFPDPATELVAGIVEKATTAEMNAGTADRYPDAATIRAYVTAAVAGSTPSGTQEEFYSGLSGTNNPATVALNTLTTHDVGTGSGQMFTFTIGPATSGDYIILLVPSDHDITRLVNTGTNLNVLSSFTKTDDVRAITGDDYHSYVLGPLNPGVTITYRVTLA